MKRYAVIIPAFRPMEQLPEYIDELISKQIEHIIIIDDGSGLDYQNVFRRIQPFGECTILTHEENCGKGAALKTGFNYYLEHLSHLEGVVTVDADGQHTLKDVLNVGVKLEEIKSGFVLGTRVFKKNKMPLRSWIGNRFTSLIFKVFFGKFINDTQTGLRGITTNELDWVTQLSGEQFDYEMNMLIQMVRKNKRIVRVDIEAVYKKDHTSHFQTSKDAKLIAKAILNQLFNTNTV